MLQYPPLWIEIMSHHTTSIRLIRNKDIFVGLINKIRQFSSLVRVQLKTRQQGMYIQGMDNVHICLYEATFDTDWFDHYSVPTDVIWTVDAATLYSILVSVSKTGYEIHVSEDEITVKGLTSSSDTQGKGKNGKGKGKGKATTTKEKKGKKGTEKKGKKGKGTEEGEGTTKEEDEESGTQEGTKEEDEEPGTHTGSGVLEKVVLETEREFTIPQVDCDYDPLIVSAPEDYEVDMTLDSKKIAEVFSELNGFGGGEVQIQLKEGEGVDSMWFISHTDKIKQIKLGLSLHDMDSFAVQEDLVLRVNYSLSYLHKMVASGEKLSDKVQIRISKTQPILITYQVTPTSYISFYLAPKNDDDEEGEGEGQDEEEDS